MTTSDKRDDIRETLKKANAIQEKIYDIDSFLRTAEKVWECKLVSLKEVRPKFFIRSCGYASHDQKNLEIDAELKNKVLNVLREEVLDLEKKLEDLLDKERDRL